MRLGRFFGEYALWHYSRAFLDIWRVWSNILWFLYSFFSIPFLFLTLFSPLQRRYEAYPEELDANEIFESFVANIILRIVGAVLRLFVVVMGVISLFVTLLCGIVFFLLWLLLPIVLGLSFCWGLSLLWI